MNEASSRSEGARGGRVRDAGVVAGGPGLTQGPLSLSQNRCSPRPANPVRFTLINVGGWGGASGSAQGHRSVQGAPLPPRPAGHHPNPSLQRVGNQHTRDLKNLPQTKKPNPQAGRHPYLPSIEPRKRTHRAN